VAVERVEGVSEATFSYQQGEGVVTFDPTLTSPEVIMVELQRMTGFVPRVRYSR
jgi:hypothetical protein